jgi:hypothetical protein
MFLNAKAPKKKTRVEDDAEEEDLNAMLDNLLNESGAAPSKPKMAAAAKKSKTSVVAPKSVYKVRTDDSYALPPPAPFGSRSKLLASRRLKRKWFPNLSRSISPTTRAQSLWTIL